MTRVQLFALAKQLAGAEFAELELPLHATVAQLKQALCEQFPALAPLMPHLMFAVNAEYASDATMIPDDAEVACIPPVSGG